MRPLSALLLPLSLAACALTPPPAPPSIDMPAAWSAPTPAGAPVADPWPAFGSPHLAQLIDEALAASPDVGIGAARVRQAEAALRSAGASRYPTVDLDAGTDARRSDGVERRSTRASLGMGVELDLWGRIAAGVSGAEAGLAASRHDLVALRLSLAAGVAGSYVDALALRARLAIARDNLAIAERLLAIVEARYRNGAASALDLARQRATVLARRAAILPLEEQLVQTRSALALLLGRPPQGFALGDEALDTLTVPEVAPGLPAELLLRRPDLAAAEARLAAASADVTAARAALLPALRLTAAGGLASEALLAFTNPSRSASLGAALAQRLFDGGARAAAIDSAEARREEQIARYRQTVLAALKEVEDALGNVALGARQQTAAQAIVAESRRALALAELRYREGADPLSEVLDAQRTLFDAKDQLAGFRRDRLTAAIALSLALGGGWQSPTDPIAHEPAR
ncbi:efflux transporter outer membrane subunit [Denitromonas iodatirespirans]|nr:efflux transporter outer membrane subunit [Denitromonas iodatirespirans]